MCVNEYLYKPTIVVHAAHSKADNLACCFPPFAVLSSQMFLDGENPLELVSINISSIQAFWSAVSFFPLLRLLVLRILQRHSSSSSFLFCDDCCSLSHILSRLPCLLDAAELLPSQLHTDNRLVSYLEPIENFSFFLKTKNHHIH